MVQKTRRADREEMLKVIYEDRRSKGILLFGFPLFCAAESHIGCKGTSPALRISKVRPPLALLGTVLTRPYLGLLKYEKRLEQDKVLRGSLSRMLPQSQALP